MSAKAGDPVPAAPRRAATRAPKVEAVVPAPLPPAEPAPPPRLGIGSRLEAGLLRPEGIDPQNLRLGGAILLAAAALFLFRGTAAAALAVTLAVSGITLGALWTGFHRLGIRALGDYWPGVTRGLAAALLLFALLPPGLPVLLVGGLTAGALLVEGRLRQAAMPLALGGVGLAWLIAWGWHARAGLGYVAPFDLRMLEDPVRLWSQFGIAVDPTRLYTGNVAGPLGVTSFGAVAIVTLALAYARDISWEYLGGFFIVLLGGGLVAGEPLTLAALQGPALAFAGLLAAERRRLPRHAAWRATAGVGAAALAVLLQRQGIGVDAYGVGVCVVAGSVALVQLVGFNERPLRGPAALASASGTAPAHVAGLTLLLPLGWWLLARDDGVDPAERRRLVLVSGALFVAAGVVALAWIYYLRLPR